MRIDAHHHLWRFSKEEYGWIGDDQAELQRDFLLSGLQAELNTAQVLGTIAVQARQTIQETDWLLELSESAASPIYGVVGWLPLADPAFERLLEPYLTRAKLKGLRHVVQAEAQGFLEDPAFNRGITALQGTGLVYDILIFAHQLPEVTRFVDRHPDQPFVLDHIAKPSIRQGEISDWASAVRELARRPNVACKLSGMVTEADPRNWTPDILTPYYETSLEAFGPARLMVGTDWPVLTVGCTYAHWWELVERWISPLSPREQTAILGKTAVDIYTLKVDEASPTQAYAGGTQ